MRPRYGRVKLAEEVAEQLPAEFVIHLIGERPGGNALASRCLSAYLVDRLPAGEVKQVAGVNVENTVEILALHAAAKRLQTALKPAAVP